MIEKNLAQGELSRWGSCIPLTRASFSRSHPKRGVSHCMRRKSHHEAGNKRRKSGIGESWPKRGKKQPFLSLWFKAELFFRIHHFLLRCLCSALRARAACDARSACFKTPADQKGAWSSVFSIPMNFTGISFTLIPWPQQGLQPLAVPSIWSATKPAQPGTDVLETFACWRAFCRVCIQDKSMPHGELWDQFCVELTLNLFSSSISRTVYVDDPMVSTISKSNCRSFLHSEGLQKATAPGSWTPSGEKFQPGYVHPGFQLVSGSGTEGISWAATMTFSDCAAIAASLPMVVVLPTPFTFHHKPDLRGGHGIISGGVEFVEIGEFVKILQ